MKTSMNVRWLLILLSLSFGTGCMSTKVSELSFEYVPADFISTYNEMPPQVYLINGQAEFDSICKRLQLAPGMHEVDYNAYFKENSLLLVYGGMQRTTGYDVNTLSVLAGKKSLHLKLELIRPGQQCMVADMITYPLQILAVEKMEEVELSFDWVARDKDCR